MGWRYQRDATIIKLEEKAASEAAKQPDSLLIVTRKGNFTGGLLRDTSILLEKYDLQLRDSREGSKLNNILAQEFLVY